VIYDTSKYRRSLAITGPVGSERYLHAFTGDRKREQWC